MAESASSRSSVPGKLLPPTPTTPSDLMSLTMSSPPSPPSHSPRTDSLPRKAATPLSKVATSATSASILPSVDLPTPPFTPQRVAEPSVEPRIGSIDLERDVFAEPATPKVTLSNHDPPPCLGFPPEPTLYRGSYRLGHVLGEGQWCIVRSAETSHSPDASKSPPHAVLAIKTPRSSRNGTARKVLHAEACILSYLCQNQAAASHIVPFYGYDLSTSSLVLGFAAQTLDGYIRNYPRPTYPDEDPLIGVRGFLAVARSLIQSLRFIHSRAIVHGDIKPSNVLLFDSPHMLMSNSDPSFAQSYRLRFSDFSSSRAISSTSTSPLDAFTVQYASPDFLRTYREAGGGIPTETFDIWGLATTLLFVGTGEEPYANASSFARLMEAKKGNVVEGVRRGWNIVKVRDGGFLMRALGGVLCKEDGKRWSLAQWEEVIDGLDAEVGGSEGSASGV